MQIHTAEAETVEQDEYWTETTRYPQTDLTLTCGEHPDADLLRYKTGPNSTWVQCTECGNLLASA